MTNKSLRITALLWLICGAVPVAAEPQRQLPIGVLSRQSAAPLLDQLKSAKDGPSARVLEAQVWSAWSHSGNPQIDGLMQRANILMAAQAMNEALALLDVVVAKAPDFSEGWNRRATVLYALNDYRASIADIAHVLKLEPRHFGALAGLGMISISKGDKAGALAAFQKVLEIDPQNKSALDSVKVLGPALEGDPI